MQLESIQSTINRVMQHTSGDLPANRQVTERVHTAAAVGRVRTTGNIHLLATDSQNYVACDECRPQ